MPSTSATINATSTSAAFLPGFRGLGTSETYKSEAVAVAAGTVITIPIAPETFPATYFVTAGAERTLCVSGLVTLYGGTKLTIPTSVGFSAAASTTADHVVVTAVAGKLTLTNAGTNAATAVTNWYVTRIA